MSVLASHQIAVPERDEAQFRALRELLLQDPVAVVGPSEQRHNLPPKLQQLLVQVLSHMEQGQAVTLLPQHQELSTQEAADLLGVSRQYLVRILEEGRLAFHRVGTHRRVYLDDLLAFRKERDRQRREALDRMARQEVEEGTYDTLVLPEA